MRGLSVFAVVNFLLFLLAACCTPMEREAAQQPLEATKVSEPAPPETKLMPVPVSIDEAMGTKGFVVCRRDADVRIVGVQELKSGKCMLVYDNPLSGNGTQNVLANLGLCEEQQQRMKENFIRAGFSCQ